MRDLIGIPFVDGGRDPKVGLDCWGMVMAVTKRLGIDVPDFKVGCFESAKIGTIVASEVNGRRWLKLQNPVPGCVVIMAIDHNLPGMINHVGTYIGYGEFIHTLAKTHSIKSSVHEPYWKDKIKGYYKWNPISS